MTKEQLENVVNAVIAACAAEGITVRLHGLIQAGVELDGLVEKSCYGTASTPPPRFSQSLNEAEKLMEDRKAVIEKVTFNPLALPTEKYTASGDGFTAKGQTFPEAISRLALRQAGVLLADASNTISAKDLLLQITPVFVEKLSR